MNLIDQDLELRGFWMGQWNERQGKSEARFANENQSRLPVALNTFQLLARMSMMAALGQLAKDGSLLAPTHKHIGISQFNPYFLFIHNFQLSYFN